MAAIWPIDNNTLGPLQVYIENGLVKYKNDSQSSIGFVKTSKPSKAFKTSNGCIVSSAKHNTMKKDDTEFLKKLN